MKRMHIHIGVENLDESIRFYSAIFGAQPMKIKPDYAKWMLDDPRVTFAISTRASRGVDHLGIQVDENNELAEIRSRLLLVPLELHSRHCVYICAAVSTASLPALAR